MAVTDIHVGARALDLLHDGEAVYAADITISLVVFSLVVTVLEPSFTKLEELRAIPDRGPPEMRVLPRPCPPCSAAIVPAAC